MGGKIYQFRYFGEGNEKNYPQYESGRGYKYYAIYEDSDSYDWMQSLGNDEIIRKIGVQTLPGAKVYINGNIHGITVGGSGILEFEAKNGTYITEFGFDVNTLNIIKDKSLLKEDGTNLLPDHCYLIMDVYTTQISNNSDSTEENTFDN